MDGSRIGVVIASLGRPDTVADCLTSLFRQTRQPDRIIVSVTCPEDLPDLGGFEGVEVLVGPKGSCNQRNAGLDKIIDDCDFVAFFDDDYLASSRAIAGIEAFFLGNDDVVGINGHLIDDGAQGAGIPADIAKARIAEFDAAGPHPVSDTVIELQGLYGCNMAFRCSAVGDVRFDERLPLYAWQEDVDFASQLRSKGRLVKTNAFAGLHRGVKTAKPREVRLGYSQIANPVYLMSKGTMSRSFGLKLMSKNLLANFLKSFRSEPWIDRPGRAKGNRVALWHFMTGKLAPERVLEL